MSDKNTNPLPAKNANDILGSAKNKNKKVPNPSKDNKPPVPRHDTTNRHK